MATNSPPRRKRRMTPVEIERLRKLREKHGLGEYRERPERSTGSRRRKKGRKTASTFQRFAGQIGSFLNPSSGAGIPEPRSKGSFDSH
jgi:hypothetical protein